MASVAEHMPTIRHVRLALLCCLSQARTLQHYYNELAFWDRTFVDDFWLTYDGQDFHTYVFDWLRSIGTRVQLTYRRDLNAERAHFCNSMQDILFCKLYLDREQLLGSSHVVSELVNCVELPPNGVVQRMFRYYLKLLSVIGHETGAPIHQLDDCCKVNSDEHYSIAESHLTGALHNNPLRYKEFACTLSEANYNDICLEVTSQGDDTSASAFPPPDIYLVQYVAEHCDFSIDMCFTFCEHNSVFRQAYRETRAYDWVKSQAWVMMDEPAAVVGLYRSGQEYISDCTSFSSISNSLYKVHIE